MKRGLALAPLAVLLLLLAACGGDGDNSGGTPGDGDGDEAVTSATPAGPALSDEEYLKVFCTGVTNYREALNTEDREGLTRVVQEYLDSMSAVNPPEDAREFHEAFLQYLRDALDEPTALVTRDPPKPPEDVRSRLADETADVAECKYPTFLNGQ